MEGVYLRLFTTESRQHDGELLYEWLLEAAKKMGVPGGSALRAIAGYGRHGRLHEEKFFELAPDLPVEVVFMMSDEQAQRFVELLEAEKLRLFYVRTRAEYGFIGTS